MNVPARVLRVVGRMDEGGLEKTIMNVYRIIDRSKLQFDFIVHTQDECDYDEEIIALGGKIFKFPRYNGINHFTYVNTWNNFFMSHREHKVIHGHIMSTASIYLKIAKKYGLKTISHSHNTSWEKDITTVLKKLMQFRVRKHADYWFACSTPAGLWYFGSDVLNKTNFKVVPNGIDTKKYKFSQSVRKQVRAELGIIESHIIGHVGSLSTRKNHDFIISVFKRVSEIKPDTVLLLVGEGKLQNHIQNRIGKSNLTGKVIMTGLRNDVHRLLQAMDIFIFPSHFEGFGNAVTEAQAAGLPCIVSDIVPHEVGITDLVEFVSLGQGVEVWANKIISKLNNMERRDMSEEIAKAGYDIKPIAKWYENFYLANSTADALMKANSN